MRSEVLPNYYLIAEEPEVSFKCQTWKQITCIAIWQLSSISLTGISYYFYFNRKEKEYHILSGYGIWIGLSSYVSPFLTLRYSKKTSLIFGLFVAAGLGTLAAY